MAAERTSVKAVIVNNTIITAIAIPLIDINGNQAAIGFVSQNPVAMKLAAPPSQTQSTKYLKFKTYTKIGFVSQKSLLLSMLSERH